MALLPVLKSDARSAADLLRFYDQAMVSYAEGVADPKQMDWGQVFLDRSLPEAWESHCVLQMDVPAGESADGVIQQMRSHFRQAGESISAAAINPSLPAITIEALEKSLSGQGFTARARQVMRLEKWIDLPGGFPDCQIIPARASYRHVQDIAAETIDQCVLSQALLNHLDDPRLDAILIMRGGEVAGYGDILSMGQTGVIQQVLLGTDARAMGVDRLILRELVEIGRRSQFRHILAGPWADDQASKNTLQSVGFGIVGNWRLWIPGT